MIRREVLKNMLFSAGSLLTLPAWGNNWNIQTLPKSKNLFSENESQTLDILVDAMIPSSIIIGAKDIGTSSFINKMLSDCYEKEAQESFRQGLNFAESLSKQMFNKNLLECDNLQKAQLLKNLSVSTDSTQKDFFNQLKSLTVLAYTTSEYVLTKHYHYVMAPGHYYGCVDA